MNAQAKSIDKTDKMHDAPSRSRSTADHSTPTVLSDRFGLAGIQQNAGNFAVQRMFQAGLIQAKLAISQPGDPDEQEADHVADQVMRMAEPASDAIRRQPQIAAAAAPIPKRAAAAPTAAPVALPAAEAPAPVPEPTPQQRLPMNATVPDVPVPAALAPALPIATAAQIATGGVIDPQAARSNIDFSTWTLDDYLNAFRVAGELTRVIPGVGLFTGVAADAVGGYQDVIAIPTGNFPFTEGLIIVRGIVNAANSALGHVKYVTELIQDGLISSAIGSAALPISAAAINVENGLKIWLDLNVQVIDSAVLVGLVYNQSLSDPGSPEFAKWQKLIDGYQANLIGDMVGTILDFVGMLSAGAANEGPISQGGRVLSTVGLLLRNHRQVLITYAQGIFNVFGSGLPGIEGEQIPIKGTPRKKPPVPAAGAIQGAVTNAIGAPAGQVGASTAEAAALLAAAGIIWEETGSVRIAWQTVDFGLSLLKEQNDLQMAELDALAKKLSGGKGLFAVIRDSGLQAIGNLRGRVDKITQFEPMAAAGRDKAEQVRGGAAGVLATIDAFTVPEITIPNVKLGEGVLADAAELVANAAKDVANNQLKRLIKRVQQAVETAKSEARTPVEGARDKAAEFITVIDIALKLAVSQKATMSKYADNFEQGLAKCNGFEDAVDLMIGQIATATGMPAFTVQEIRDGWASIPGELDRLDVLTEGLRTRAARLAREEEEDKVDPPAAAAAPPEK